MSDRARQFLPFDALKGFKEAIKEREKIKVEKIQIGDEIFTYRVDSTGVPHIQIGKVGAVYEKENHPFCGWFFML